MARLLAAGHAVRLSDGCGGLPGIGGILGGDAEQRARQLGVLAGEAVWQALAATGRKLTRARFLAALEQVRPGLSFAGAAPVLTEHRNGS